MNKKKPQDKISKRVRVNLNTYQMNLVKQATKKAGYLYPAQFCKAIVLQYIKNELNSQ